MPLTKKPVTGMKDILPAENEIRDYVLNEIKETYRSFGFQSVETPCVEHIENLLSKQGGDNEKLIFKILKRGEKLDLSGAENENDLVDSGLRYDLTLPLARYYANNASNLPSPFKALQTGNVWRADRPQRGRFRQFMQCDIDILGDASDQAEIELILATTSALEKICPGYGFKVRINDRRILRAMAVYAGFPEEDIEKVLITVDKMDKIGDGGVKAELIENGYSEECADKYLSLMQSVTDDTAGVKNLGKALSGILEEGTADNLIEIIETVKSVTDGALALVFDPALVRGMGYYTGTIFEISMEGFSGSVAGGGRYDRMIGRFTGIDTPACGFSIGFERIVTILLENGFKVPCRSSKEAWLYEKGMDKERLAGIMKEAGIARAGGSVVLLTQMNKNKKFQKEQLEKDGYTGFREFYREEMKH